MHKRNNCKPCYDDLCPPKCRAILHGTSLGTYYDNQNSIQSINQITDTMKFTRNTLICLFAVLALQSCMLRPIASQYDYQKNKGTTVNLETLGNGHILIYNGADILHKIDNSAGLNMWVNKKPMGQFSASEYAIIELPKGEYTFDLLHVDVFNFNSAHDVKIDETTKVIRIEPTVCSNKLTITNQLPAKIEKFNYVEKR